MVRKGIAAIVTLLVGLSLLKADREPPSGSTSVKLAYPKRFGKPKIPSDNELTKERIALGERLFHDTILSIDGTVSCAACHVVEFAFSDDVDLSRGFEGRLGKRNSPPIFNLAWKDHFFWDGRAKTVREQVLQPIQDHLEMAANLNSVVYRLNRRKSYREDFEKAYGPGKITSDTLSLALENYLLTIVSGDSKFDRALDGKEKFTSLEDKGRKLFYTEHEKGGAGCFQCHGGPHFRDFDYRNNGLKTSRDLNDLGRHKITGKDEDKFLFSTPSLRNIALTSPYMHDGRFEKLADVIEHYNSELHQSPTLDPRLKKQGLGLDEVEKKALLAFLETLTDSQFIEETE
ncbi:MAG: cytochrome c peroxidase [Akkermansiaceae bacterium]